MKLVASGVLAIVAACGDNIAYPEDTIYTGSIGTRIAVEDGFVYFGTYGESFDNDHAIRRVPTAGGGSEVLWSGGAHELIVDTNVVVVDGTVYWCEEVGQAADFGLFGVPVTGDDRAQLASGLRLRGPASDGTFLYAHTDTEVLRVAIAGGTVETIFTADRDSIDGIALDGSTVYVRTTALPVSPAGYARATVWTLFGGTATQLDTIAAARPGAPFAVDGTYAWVATEDGIAKLLLATAGTSTLVLDTRPGYAVYRTPAGILGLLGLSDDQAIVRPMTAGLEVIADHLSYVGALASDGARVFYTGASGPYVSPYLASIPL